MEAEAKRQRAERFRELFEDQTSFRRWYDDALSVVYPFVFARCGAIESLAVEITQETFVEAVRARDSFDGTADPVTWLCAIARHKIADHFRRLDRERRRLLRLVHRNRDADMKPEEAMEEQQAVARALAELPPNQRAALTMHYLDQMPAREIGAALGKTERAIESLLARARDGFRRSYGAGASDES